MKLAELQTAYRERGHFISARRGTWYITKVGKPLQILKRFSEASASDIGENIKMLAEFAKND